MWTSRPWPLRDIVAKLALATEHLLRDHACDAHGYEAVNQALAAAKEWLTIHGDGLSHATGGPFNPEART